jgi:predicted P-loop ATPase
VTHSPSTSIEQRPSTSLVYSTTEKPNREFQKVQTNIGRNFAMFNRKRKVGIITRIQERCRLWSLIVQYFPPKCSFAYCCSHAWFLSARDTHGHIGSQTQIETYFCRLPNLLADGFPLVGVVLFDRGKQRSALLTH